MTRSFSLQDWSFRRVISALILGAVSIAGCGQQQMAGVGTGGTGGYKMGGAIQGITLSLTNTVTTIAGTATTVAGTVSSADGTGAGARFNGPTGVTSDGTNLYVVDSRNGTIRKVVIATGAVTTLAGTAGVPVWTDGIGNAAGFNHPQGITIAGPNLYVAELGGTIRKIVIATREVTTLAGSNSIIGAVDGIGTAARFNYPRGITNDGTNLYVTDSGNNTIRKIVIATGAVSTLAGTAGLNGHVDGTGSEARFDVPMGITTDGANLYVTDSSNGNGFIRKIELATGSVTTLALAASFSWAAGIATDGVNLYVADTQSHTIRMIEISSGTVTTLAGSIIPGSADGYGNAASFAYPEGITTDGANLYVADTQNNTIRKVVISSGAVTTLAGAVGADGIGPAAQFFTPMGITTDGANLYVTDYGRCTIRKIVIATGTVTTIAGVPNDAGLAVDERFGHPQGITTDGTYLYVVAGEGSTIRKIEISTGVVTTLAGSALNFGSTDGTGAAARFYGLCGITTDGTNLFATDAGNGTIRKIEISTGTVTTMAGTAGTVGSADGTGATASFSDQLLGITTDGKNLYVADSQTIRKIVISTGVVTTLAGVAGLTGNNDGIGAAARFGRVNDITTDGTNLYVADTYSIIRKVVISNASVTTIAGSGSIGASDGTGFSASFRFPQGIITDGTSLYVADTGNNIIRKIQ